MNTYPSVTAARAAVSRRNRLVVSMLAITLLVSVYHGVPMSTPRSQFASSRISREDLIANAKAHCSRAGYLASLGIKKRSNLGLEQRMKAEGLTLDDLWPNRWCADCRFPEEAHVFDLTREDHAYFYGLALADGHLQESDRNRGKLTIELKSTDSPILDAVASTLPWKSHRSNRSRVTNFGPLTVAALVYHSRGLRKQLIDLGFPVGKKSDICAPPTAPYHEGGFWRGFIDGDGSLGFIADGRPYLSLVTTSDGIAHAFLDLVQRVTGKIRTAGRNARDNAYNIMAYAEDTQALVSAMYWEGCLAIPRKLENARLIKGWTRDPLPVHVA